MNKKYLLTYIGILLCTASFAFQLWYNQRTWYSAVTFAIGVVFLIYDRLKSDK